MKYSKAGLFENARIKLSVYYLMIIMIISGLFSLIIYGVIARQIERLYQPSLFLPDYVTEEFINEQKQNLMITLIWIDAVIWMASTIAGYFLAGQTLQPILEMVDEQNQFISDASHELRTPIATLRAEMEAGLLEKKINTLQAKKLIGSNLEELDRLQKLAENLLKLTRIHSINKKPANKIPAEDLINMVVKKMTPIAKNKNIGIRVFGIKDMANKGLKIQEDIGDVLTILLDNAIKYSPRRSKIEVKLEKLKHEMKLSVSDQGIGISGKDIQHIFERFYRADQSRSQEGYGLGLSIAKYIVEEQNGKIEVESQTGKGASFKIHLPV